MLIGVTGYAQHGKNTVGEWLRDEWGFEMVAFADQLRALAWDLNPIIKTNDGIAEVAIRYQELVTTMGYEEAKKVHEVRRILVALGIGVREHVGPDAWVAAAARRIGPLLTGGGHVVLTDVRFPNEAEYVEQWGELVRVTRPDFESGVPHDNPAEVFVETFAPNWELTNEGDVNGLRRQVNSMMHKLGGVPVSIGESQDAGASPAPSTGDA